MSIHRPVILGIAKGHSAQELRPFVVSLRKTGYAGDVSLFVDNLSPEALDLLHEHRITLHAFPQRHFIRARRHFLRMLAGMLPEKSRADARITLSQYYLHLIDARWPAYYTFLKATRGLYSHVMFTDVKDVVFQRDPFDFDWKAALCSFYEPPGFFIKNESHTSGWLKEGFGEQEARELGDKRIVCCGMTIAETEAAFEYVTLMCENLVRINARGLVDQGIHNHLLHRRRLKSFYVYDYPETPALNLGLLPPGKLELNGQGLVVNGSGRVVNAIHQYFPHREQMARCLEQITAL
jgi:hypothetical protein